MPISPGSIRKNHSRIVLRQPRAPVSAGSKFCSRTINPQTFGQALDYAATLDCKRIHVMSGITAESDQTEVRHTLLANLEYALGQIDQSDLSILIEPINTRDIPGYYLSTVEQADSILEELSHPALKIQFDWYHAQIMGGDLARRTEKYFSKIGHLQLAGVPDRAEPDQGEVNFPYLFQLVDSLHYSGWIGCEYRPRGRTEEGLDWLPKTSYA
jgi:hydroxypyruvate isomerase